MTKIFLINIKSIFLIIFQIIINNKFLLLNIPKANNLKNNLECGHSSVVERLVANEKVEGSSPFARSNTKI